MKPFACTALLGLALFASPALAQDDAGEIIVTAQRRMESGVAVPVIQRRPVIGLKRQADSALRHIEIVSDSLDEDMRKSEVQVMLLAALDLAKREGLSLVTGQYEVAEVTRENWREQFPGLARNADDADDEDDEDEDDDDDDDDDDNNRPQPGFTDDGSKATVRLMVKTRLDGPIANAQRKITVFVNKVPATGRSEIRQVGDLGLTIVNPEQYRDEIYRRIAVGAKHALEFYGADYGVNVTGLDREIDWAQVSNAEVFLYIPYGFTVGR